MVSASRGGLGCRLIWGGRRGVAPRSYSFSLTRFLSCEVSLVFGFEMLPRRRHARRTGSELCILEVRDGSTKQILKLAQVGVVPAVAVVPQQRRRAAQDRDQNCSIAILHRSDPPTRRWDSRSSQREKMCNIAHFGITTSRANPGRIYGLLRHVRAGGMRY